MTMDIKLFPIKSKGKYGYVNVKGETCIEIKYGYAEEFIEDLAVVAIDDYFGFIDKKGNEIVKIEYDDVYDFVEGLAAVDKEGKLGM
ncbi:WG repeat-containing protein [Clostridium botulinum]|nr:WG repeat-containing protein [Clostridium botulinum]